MPIQVPPGLEDSAEELLEAVAAQNANYELAITQKQAEIDGTPPPGLQAAEDINKDLYDQYSARLAYFEDERRALDGVYPSPVLLEADILEAATTRSGVLFPISNLTLIPTRVDYLDGIGGSDGNNEAAQLAAEAAAIATLLGLPLIDRATDDAFDDWVASLQAQQGLLQTESTAIALNESYGNAHSAWTQAQAALSAVLALLLAGPAVDDTTLNNRAAAVTARQAAVTARLAVLATDREEFYDNRFLLLQGRVHLVIGSLARLTGAQSGIQTLTDISSLNSALLALYNQLV